MTTEETLRGDVRLLGELLGDVLRRAEGPELFALVERVRALAKGARTGQGEDLPRLEALLHGLDAGAALPLTRAFAHFLALANVAEQAQRARVRRAAAAIETPLAARLRALVAAGAAPAALATATQTLEIELVLTAHPTQAVRRTLLEKYRRIAEALLERAASGVGPAARARLEQALHREVAAIWHTDELRRRPPTPVDEARAGLVLFEQVLWDALPEALRGLDEALVATTGVHLSPAAAPLRFGSWMGGDRDGNPAVTAAVTEEVLWLMRWEAADLYLRELRPLRDELSMRAASEALAASVGGAREPYRALLDGLIARAAATRRHARERLAELAGAAPPAPRGDAGGAAAARADAPILRRAEELWAPLALLHRSLHATGAGVVAGGRLTDLLRRVSAFGLTLARLDLRQEAGAHARALDAVTGLHELGRYSAWDEARRQAWLVAELRSRRPLLPRDAPEDPALAETLATLRVVAAHEPESFGAYVVSMASRPSDVLAVQLLQKEAGVRAPLRVVPLFETLADLQGAGEALGALLDVPAYRAACGGRQEVMVGYSDSTKDAGRLGAAWALWRAQEDLVAAARARDVRVTLFHGRGGTVARGGAPVHLAILSQPPGSIEGRLRVTVQGEAIDSSFALPDIAVESLELYLGATLEATLAPPAAPPRAWRDAMDALASEAFVAYREVRDDPAFPAYFRAATPEPELALLRIGSRPVRRPGGAPGLAALRAIPWVFAWTQNRLMLPAWLGTERALAAARAGAHAGTVREMARRWPFLRAFLDLSEMVLAKADADVASVYERLLVPPELAPLGARLRRALGACVREVLAVRDHATLLAEEPQLAESIALRNPYVDPLNLLQAELLRRLRGGADDETLVDALLITVNGIAAGMRNTG
jgi:phosphoenolpyruvate carboxylase